MDQTISNEWNLLYANNPKIQAFAVLKEGEIVWQTSNWNLVDVAADLAEAPTAEKGSIEIGGVKYTTVSSSSDTFVATAGKEQGHLLMSLVEGSIWLIAWATPDSIPELTIVDLGKTAIQLIRRL